jgi:hypothetical protein
MAVVDFFISRTFLNCPSPVLCQMMTTPFAQPPAR